MSRIKSADTGPERSVRKFLYKNGFRYRINYHITGKPDIVFPGKRIAVFVNGCFWHRHGCRNSVMPKTNRVFWRKKLSANVSRDKKVEKILKKEGWSVYRIWECELEKKEKNKTFARLNNYLRKKSYS